VTTRDQRQGGHKSFFEKKAPAAIPQAADWMFLQPSVLDELHDAVISTDLEGVITGCNRAAHEIYGWTCEELVGQKIIDFYSEEDKCVFSEQVLPSVMATGSFRGEVRNRTRAGDYIFVHLAVMLLRDADGNPAGLVGFSADVTGQKLGSLAVRRMDEIEREPFEQEAGSAHSALQRVLAERDRLSRGMEVASLALAEVDYVTGMNHLSAEAARMYGIGNEAAVVPRGVVHATFHPEDRQELMQKVAACMDPGGAGWFAMDHRILWPSGEVRWLRVRQKAFFEGEGAQRRPVRAILAAYDVTVERNASEQIRQSELTFRTMAESMPQMVWAADASGRRVYCNQKYLNYAGVASAEAMEAQWVESLHPEDRLSTLETWRRSMATGEPYLKEYRLRRHDGVYRHFIARALPVRNEQGDVERWLGSLTDIHDQKMKEEALRRSEMLSAAGRLAASVAHEINNPLESVTNLLYLLKSNPSLDAEALAYLTTAEQELARVSEIATQTLRFHKQSTLAAPTQITEVVDSILALYKARMQAADVHLIRDYSRVEPLTCLAGDVRQAISNLVSNAIDAAPREGKLRVRVRSTPDWAERVERGVRITVADTGSGIDKANSKRIFDAFYSTKGMTNAGLGLWITQDLVARSGGSIRMRSSTRPGKSGTVFSIHFPFDAV
jgi:PAS domain S-box-containing protein